MTADTEVGLSVALRAHEDRRVRASRSVDTVRDGSLDVSQDDTVADVVEVLRHVRPDAKVADLTHLRHALVWLATEVRVLKEAPLTFVSGEVVELVSVAAETMGEDTLFESDLFAPSGWLYLARPMMLADVHPVTGEVSEEVPTPIRAVMWHTADIGSSGERVSGRGVVAGFYSDAGLVRSIVWPTHEQVLGVAPAQSKAAENLEEWWLFVCSMHGWAFGEPWSSTPPDAEAATDTDGEVVAGNVAALRRWFLALMRFCWQEMVVSRAPSGREMSRQQVRQRRRSGRSEVSVMYLRRLDTDSGVSGSGRSLTVQVLVRGHWRRQWYPSLGQVGDAAAYRRIWIDPHVKGPAGAPLRHRRKVIVVR